MHSAAGMNRRRIAWMVILVVDLGYVAWGTMAAVFLNRLLGPGGQPILPAGYEGFTRGSWSELVKTAPMTARYIDMVFRLYGVYCAVFGLMGSAIAVTAFRRGERWAWWALLAGNTIARGDDLRPNRERHRTVRDDGIPRHRPGGRHSPSPRRLRTEQPRGVAGGAVARPASGG
jgi:hypothetical protein